MDKQTALELYKVFRQENSSWLESQREHSQQYITLVIAILGASIAALQQFPPSNPIVLLATMGPLINLILCRLGTTMCNRSYQAYIEGLSIQSKLEQVIGLTEHRNPPIDGQIQDFPKDEYFLPERWLKSRHFATAYRFVEESSKKGANGIIKQTFTLLSLINGLVAFGMVAYLLMSFMGLDFLPR